MHTSTLVNDGTVRSTADFSSALSNVNNVKTSDVLEFLVMLLFFSLCSHSKIICGGGCEIMKTSMREILFLITEFLYTDNVQQMFHLHSYHIFFDLWNIFEHVLRYFIINNNDYNNNYNLLLTFQRVDVY